METRHKGSRTEPLTAELFSSPLFKREKLLMERAFLPDIEPKEKETCRKRVLRSFFLTAYEKQAPSPPVLSTQIAKFWTWIKALNPDLSRGEGKYKSMSYSFLDFLLSKETFRTAMLQWIGDFEQTMTGSVEDGKTLLFLDFVRKAAAKKVEMEAEIEAFLRTLPPIPPHTSVSQGSLFTQSSPHRAGLYLATSCLKPSCSQRGNRALVHLGQCGRYEFLAFARLCQCFVCFEPCQVQGITVASSRWLYQGEKTTGERVVSSQMATL